MATTRSLSLIVSEETKLNNKDADNYGYYELELPNRSGSNEIHLEIKEDDTIKLVFEDDFTWLATPDDFAEIIDIQNQSRSSDGKAPSISRSTSLSVGQERGFSIVKELLGFGLIQASKIAARALAAKMEAQVLESEGLNRVELDLNLTPIKDAPIMGEGPVLLLLHGTGSSTHGSFAHLFHDKKLHTDLHQQYAGNIYAFDHKTCCLLILVEAYWEIYCVYLVNTPMYPCLLKA